MVAHYKDTHQISIRKACNYLNISYSAYYYKARIGEDDAYIEHELSTLAEQNPRWGFWMMRYRLKNKGFKGNHKKIYRIYTSMGLNLRSKRKKRLPTRVKEPLVRPIYPNVTWSMDFMSDSLESGKKVRTLNIIDDFNREILAVRIEKSLPSEKVISTLKEVMEWRGKPDKIRVDNGPEFIAEKLQEWLKTEEIELHFIEPGKPTQNSLIERFNRTFRSELLNAYLFGSIKEMRNYAENWMWSYNNERPHSSLLHLSPRDFLLKYGKISSSNPADFPTFQQSFYTNNNIV